MSDRTRPSPLVFNPDDPFPLIDLQSVSYADQQQHSANVDAWLGMKTYEVEEKLSEVNEHAALRPRGEKYWIGLPVEALLTPYVELRFILERVNPVGLVVDLGAGYGRMGFVLARHFPLASFLGIEVVPERVREGARVLPAGTLVESDLTRMTLPEASTYFLYDYGSASAIEKTLADLREISLKRPIVVVGRGGATRSSIDRRHPWLSGVQTPEHFPHFSIYRS